MLPLSSFDPSVHRTSPGRYFVASSNACFLFSITIFPSKQVPFLIISTGSTPFAGSIECSIVICQASHCPLPKNGRIMTQLGFKDLKLVPLAHDFTFPNATDVFGWTEGSWSIFDGIKTLDLAGQSFLHYAIDRYGDLEPLDEDGVGFAQALGGYKNHKLLGDSGLLTARCNKQTPLHRAARTGNRRLVEILLKWYADLYAALNAADFYGRTALCLATQYGKSEVVDVLCEKMDQDGLNRTDNYERNALHYVVLNHKEDAALNLIEHKINYTGRDRKDRPPLWYAAQNGMEKVVIRSMFMIWVRAVERRMGSCGPLLKKKRNGPAIRKLRK